mmetsp:Transcript_11886/g.37783  ORF Transcript_11886/g.37783 Transcript_11886/m.37783 type:complete len:598 (+) Transcript_11886:62-1855(+)
MWLLFCLLLVSYGACLPSSWFILSDSVIGEAGEVASLALADRMNVYLDTPAIVNDTTAVSYTLSHFHYTVALGEVAVRATTSATVSVDVGAVAFSTSFDFKVCGRLDEPQSVKVCEHGVILIYSPSFGPTCNLSFGIDISFDGPQVNVGPTALSPLLGNASRVGVLVACEDAICVIPSHKIVDAISAEIPTVVAQGLSAALALLAKDAAVPTMERLGPLGLLLNGSFVPAGPGLAVAMDGSWVPLPPTGTNNPFGFPRLPRPDSAPAEVKAMLASPPAAATMVFLPSYVFASAYRAAADAGLIATNVTNADLPAHSFFALDTSDPLLLGIAPGLLSYPNMNVSFSVMPAYGAAPTFSPTTVTDVKLSMNATLSNATLTVANAFSLLGSFNTTANVTSFLNQSGTGVVVRAALSHSTVAVDAGSSRVGPLHTGLIGPLVNALLPELAPSQVNTTVPVPGALRATSVTTRVGSEVVALLLAGVTVVPPANLNSTMCPLHPAADASLHWSQEPHDDGGQFSRCPQGVLCCPGFGCCAAGSGASCCPVVAGEGSCCPGGFACCPNGGCCPSGTECCGNECCEPGTPAPGPPYFTPAPPAFS